MLISKELPGGDASHPLSAHQPAARPAAVRMLPTRDTGAHSPRLVQLETLASMAAVVRARFAEQDIIATTKVTTL